MSGMRTILAAVAVSLATMTAPSGGAQGQAASDQLTKPSAAAAAAMRRRAEDRSALDWLAIATDAQRRGDPVAARQALDRALTLDATDPEIALEAARLALAAGLTEDADRLLAEATARIRRRPGNDVTTLRTLADLTNKLGKLVWNNGDRLGSMINYKTEISIRERIGERHPTRESTISLAMAFVEIGEKSFYNKNYVEWESSLRFAAAVVKDLLK